MSRRREEGGATLLFPWGCGAPARADKDFWMGMCQLDCSLLYKNYSIEKGRRNVYNV